MTKSGIPHAGTVETKDMHMSLLPRDHELCRKHDLESRYSRWSSPWRWEEQEYLHVCSLARAPPEIHQVVHWASDEEVQVVATMRNCEASHIFPNGLQGWIVEASVMMGRPYQHRRSRGLVVVSSRICATPTDELEEPSGYTSGDDPDQLTFVANVKPKPGGGWWHKGNTHVELWLQIRDHIDTSQGKKFCGIIGLNIEGAGGHCSVATPFFDDWVQPFTWGQNDEERYMGKFPLLCLGETGTPKGAS